METLKVTVYGWHVDALVRSDSTSWLGVYPFTKLGDDSIKIVATKDETGYVGIHWADSFNVGVELVNDEIVAAFEFICFIGWNMIGGSNAIQALTTQYNASDDLGKKVREGKLSNGKA